ncbi:hypothetical protein BCD67_22635 [Oscillatoriales cyanobacterium USR001]|nr:hypothetical protein BCD67_22635 [Oscillatoriales cyanobacterium USR001]
MGLAERRAIKKFVEGRYLKLKQEIDAAAGFDVPIEVNWDSLATEDYADAYEDAFYKVYFRPLIDALKAIAIDDLGKEALKENLKKIVIEDSGSSYPTFQSGILTLKYYAQSNLDDWMSRKKDIQTHLEKGL